MKVTAEPARKSPSPIGVFDSGFGGLTVLSKLIETMPEYSYLYLADRARGPYGALSPEVINTYTRQAVEYLFGQGCPLVVLACNTASAWALRNLQQRFLPAHYPTHRILGVVRPSAEALAGLPVGAPSEEASNASGTVAVLATHATVSSNSYGLELAKLAPGIQLIQRSCAIWVPLVEEGEISGPGADYFLHKYLDPLLAPDVVQPSRILLGCTHYPFLFDGIRKIVPASIEVLGQAQIVADRLVDWLARHPEMRERLDREGVERLTVTADEEAFERYGTQLLGRTFSVERVSY
ncbi:MAG TPA: glutamate racemase [Polyangiales bacterium]|nr:glutamate racemase [Polyangiales bacterium]